MMTDMEKVIREIEDALSGNLAKAGHIYGLSLVGLKDKALTDALALLKKQEAVVQCKDCKYYDNFNGCMSWHDVNSNNDNWYCADGERKEGR